MSDTENDEIPIKKKVIMTQERLDKLKIAREAAMAKCHARFGVPIDL